MSSDFYFRKWKKTLVELKAVVKLDIHLQETKAHDKKLCEATERLSGFLARYNVIYNDVWECLHQNLQVQKTGYMRDVLKAVVSRILELKHELQKLEVSEYNFGNNGLIDHILTPDDAQLDEVPDIDVRPENVQTLIKEVFEQVKERKKQLEKQAAKKESPERPKTNWWDADDIKENDDDAFDIKKEELSEEQKQTQRMAALIQAHEKTRRVIADMIQKRNKRERWEKELLGTLRPSAPYEIREKASQLIQQVCRAFFELKREKILQCRRNELLGITPCLKPKSEQKQKLEKVKESRRQLRRKYEEKWLTEYKCLKENFLKKRSEDIREDYRDYIREWFKTWYESIIFFHNIPAEKHGGATLILREELPTPEEWLEEYNTHLADKKANTSNTALEKKLAKLQAKQEEMERKRAEQIKKKFEDKLRQKMMKNPTLHPGFDYPLSNKTIHILEVIDKYNKDWAEEDANETLDVKEKSVRHVDMNKIYMEAKMELVPTVEDDMRKELKLLKKALKQDYENKGEKMPEPKKEKYKKQKKKVVTTLCVNIAEKLENLAFHGYMIEYPKTKIEEFIGDPNFAGDDLRKMYDKVNEIGKSTTKEVQCYNLLTVFKGSLHFHSFGRIISLTDGVKRTALPHNGEIRSLWWEKCRELSHGRRKILLVGPRGSGKTTLVYVLATMNDAVIFKLDPQTIHGMLATGPYLKQLVQSMASCAKAVQPSVIHIKDVHRLFYRKVPRRDIGVDWKLIQRFFINKLFRHFQKTDKVTIIGTCVDPWVTKTNKMLKHFPTVVLLPNTSHGTVVKILKDWALSYTVIPADFEVSCLAHVLRGYSFGYLKSILKKFMTAETIAKIAARGLSPMDVYNFIIQDATEEKVDYEKYLKWYSDKTSWGKREQKHQKEQLAFKQALADYEQKMDKKMKSTENTSSHTTV